MIAVAILSAGTVAAWTGPTGVAPNNNVSAPINVSATAQTKAGPFTIQTPTNGTGFSITTGTSGKFSVGDGTAGWTVMSLYGTADANWTNSNFFVNPNDPNFYILGPTINSNYQFFTKNWSWAPVYANNFYSQAVGQWTSNALYYDRTAAGGSYFGSDGNIYMPWAGQWLSTAFDDRLKYDTWGRGSTYYGSNGDIYMPWKGQWLSTALNAVGSPAWSSVSGKPYPINGQTWNWSGQGGQPSWLWGSNDGTNMYVWNPSNFSVNYANSANSANNANTVGGYGAGSFCRSDGSNCAQGVGGVGFGGMFSWNTIYNYCDRANDYTGGCSCPGWAGNQRVGAFATAAGPQGNILIYYCTN